RPAVAVLDDGGVLVEVERDHQGPRPVGRRQGCGLPPAGGEAQRRVLELRLGSGQGDRQLAQELGGGVHRVTGVAPRLVGEGDPRNGGATIARHDRGRWVIGAGDMEANSTLPEGLTGGHGVRAPPGRRQWANARYWWTERTAADPSPTAEATR